jgi:branched-chain amino acid transport system substrate-binding protein
MKSTCLATLLASLLLTTAAFADDKIVKLGELDDQSSLYADSGGPGSVLSVNMAVEDSGLRDKGWKIDVISADHQNKPDVGVGVARQWFDVDKVDAIIGVQNSGVALAVTGVAKEKNGILLDSGAASSDLTGKACNPNMIHWAYDTYALANGTGKAIVKQGGDTWFFITADYAFGHALQRDTSAIVEANGGKVVGSANVPINTPDFSSFLLEAQASKAKVVGLANAGGDTVNSIKQAHEFGIVAGGQKLAALLIFISNVHALGLEIAQGLTFTETFYWDLNDQTRAWTKRWHAERKDDNKVPTMNQAGVYSGTLHYLKAVAALKSAADGKAVVAEMKKLPAEDEAFGKSTVRQDGRVLHPAYLVEVKKPSESKYKHDFYNVRATIPANEAFRPLKDGGCPLVSG